MDLKRDTNQRFWGELASTSGEFTYTIKFLRSSITFPFSVTSQVFERRADAAGVHVELGTRGGPPEGALRGPRGPLVLWARVSMDGRPVVGAEVSVRITHEASGEARTLSMRDDGSTGEEECQMRWNGENTDVFMQ